MGRYCIHSYSSEFIGQFISGLVFSIILQENIKLSNLYLLSVHNKGIQKSTMKSLSVVKKTKIFVVILSVAELNPCSEPCSILCTSLSLPLQDYLMIYLFITNIIICLAAQLDYELLTELNCVLFIMYSQY